jgi:hypothetical protein
MVWTVCLSMLVSMLALVSHLWATMRGISLPVTSSLRMSRVRTDYQALASQCNDFGNLQAALRELMHNP